ncbi:MAG: protein kinase domain-containing protein [Gemmatimonadota bacterium]
MTDALRDRVVAALGETYEIDREIGRGGMGVVYGARDRKLRRGVAIKVLPPELAYRDDVRQRFLREAQTAAQLSHPNIVPIYAVEECDGLVCFAMELVDGESLASKIAREGRLPYDESTRVLAAVADALGYAHARGTVHRDVKPDNILLDSHGRVMVTDFGIARAAEGDARLTVTGIAVGTPAYMSPEQALGEKEVDGRSDIYSLAIVGYHMLAGTLPFHASNTPAMLMKHIAETPRSLTEVRPGIPRRLVRALEKAMAKKPSERWTSSAEFRTAILRAGGAESTAGAAALPMPGQHRAVTARPALRSSRRQSSADHGHPEPGRSLQRNERSAIDAANAGFDPRARGGGVRRRTANDETNAPLPAWLPPAWREAREQWKVGHDRGSRRGSRYVPAQGAEAALADRIRKFRKRTASGLLTIFFLATFNIVFSPNFLWFLFPAAVIALGWLQRGASLWADGVRLHDVFGARAVGKLAERRPLAVGPGASDLAARLAPPEVLAGPHGATVKRAASDQAAIRDAVDRLSKPDRELIPDVLPTVDSLADRVGSIALSLHRLDEDIGPGTLGELDARIASARGQPESRERERKVELLEHRRATIADLSSRRETLVAQLESASLMLQNMRLDLIALRSAGVQSVINDVGSATQEARALSREIANALAAAKEVR